MNDRHIAIFNVPGPTHTSPTLSVVSTLVRRGFRVTYVTSERFASKIASLGAEVLRCPRFEFPYNQVDQSTKPPIERQFSTDLLNLASRTLDLVSPFYERNIPSVILYDTYAFAGRIVAERLNVPALRMTPHLGYSAESLSEAVVPSEFRDMMIEFSKSVDSFYRKNGVSQESGIGSVRDPTLYFYLRALQLENWSEGESLYAARCAAENPVTEGWKSQCSDGRPAILISASTTYDQGVEYYKKCIEALSRFRWHIVLAIGSNTDPSSFDTLPPHCEIVRHIPQVMIMPHVELMVCLGGMSTTMEAMYHGVPLVMLSHGHSEAELYAGNVQRRRLGLHLKGKSVNIEEITESVRRVSEDEQLRASVKEAQTALKRSPGAEEAVNWVEEYIER